jgi:integrase
MRTKTFILQMDVKDPDKKSGYRTIKKTLGRYGDEITLEQARELIRGHVDRETGEAVLGERIKIKMGDAAVSTGDTVTLGELVTQYFTETKRRDGKERRLSSTIAYRHLIERHYGDWLPVTLKEINTFTPDVVIAKYQQIALKTPMSARNSSIVLSSAINYGLAKFPGTLKINPLQILTSRYVNIVGPIKSREECLIFDAGKRRNDFKTFCDGIQSMAEVRRDLALLTLYTGMRRAEASTLTWSCIDFERKALLIQDTKNRQPLNIPLNRQAMVILDRRKKLANNEPWVFPAVVTVTRSRGFTSINPVDLKAATGLEWITIHALRRTFITVGRKLKRYEDTDKLTNHIDSSMAGKHYDQTSIEDIRETCQMIGNELERLMVAESAKVIPITRKAA